MRYRYALALLLVVACDSEHASPAPDAAIAPPSPLGTWNVDVTWGPGTCGADYAATDGFVVKDDAAGGYAITNIYFSPTTATVSCSTAGCELDATEEFPVDGGTFIAIDTLSMAPDGAITGSGSVSVTGTTTCMQSYTLRGSRSVTTGPSAAPAPPTCTAVVASAPVGGGNTSCQMTVTTTVTCPHGQGGRVVAVFGESGGPTLFAASLDAAYQCGVPVIAGRYGIDCANIPAADVVWYAPDGSGPHVCAQ